MNTIESTTSIDNYIPSDERKTSPPAFLDLADSAARLGTNLPGMLTLKQEHERQRLIHMKHFEDQMRALKERQAQELLKLPYEAGTGLQHLAVSAPTTPPRLNAQLGEDNIPATRLTRLFLDGESFTKADKRKSVSYAPTVNLSPDLTTNPTGISFTRAAGAKSMPASRRTSASEHDEDLAVHIQGLSLAGGHSTAASPAPAPPATGMYRGNGRYNDEQYASIYNAGMMLDEQLDKEMHNAMKHLPTSDDDKYHGSYPSKASAALDLAQLSRAPSQSGDSRESPSEWPKFARTPEGSSRSERRTVTNPNLTVSAPSDDIAPKLLGGTGSASGTPLIPQGSSSRRGSPHSLLETLSASRSVPATPLGLPPNLLKTPGTPITSEVQSFNARISTPNSQMIADNMGNVELQGTLSRLPHGSYDNGNLSYNTAQANRDDYQAIYGMNNGVDAQFNTYGFESAVHPNVSPSSGGINGTAGIANNLYPQNVPQYAVLPGRTPLGGDTKLNGFHGAKHKRGEVDREFNRFAGTRLEDLQGEISALCKDQHGCRYLQKKLEEGAAEHRDMIFRETFTHFAELMTDPFGNYLCQKLLEYSTDEQRNVICDSVGQDLVNISLNMHGTRAVQKMIDFLSTRRQTDQRYNAQIHSIILALSLHVVVLIKDLNGNHVIQKCLNKLAPEDNQFIYNAVATNCVEVATHRHGCCVLQRCIDHASEMQRAQLVSEITYNALTLVQDPYGNYVVQYILDLNEHRFSDALIRQFTGNICALSVQKFSSNVIEKCIRVAEHNTRKMIIDELMNRSRLEKLLRDSYGNYCVQTALDYAEPTQRSLLVEGIRPVLPLIRNTPYGKRIQNKLQREQMDHHFNGFPNQQALVNMALSHQGMAAPPTAGRHHGQNPAANPMADVYGASNALYSLQGQASFGQTPLNSQMHALQPQSIDGYVLQRNSTHNQGMQQPGSFPAATFTTLPGFGGALNASLNDPYQRSTFGYGM